MLFPDRVQIIGNKFTVNEWTLDQLTKSSSSSTVKYFTKGQQFISNFEVYFSTYLDVNMPTHSGTHGSGSFGATLLNSQHIYFLLFAIGCSNRRLVLTYSLM